MGNPDYRIDSNGNIIPRPNRSVIGRDLGNLRISDHYTSLLHLSGQTGGIQFEANADGIAPPPLPPGFRSDVNPIYDGAGTMTGFSLSSLNDRVIINNYIACSGYGTPTDWLEAFYPIGSVIMTVNNNNPSGRIKGTKWCRVGNGRFFVGVGRDTVVNQEGEAQTYEFTAGIDGELLGETTEDVGTGNIAGSPSVELEVKHIPGHSHQLNTGLNTRTTINNESGSSNASFIFYFGPPVNPEKLSDPDKEDAFLEQDRIEAFQNNTQYEDDQRYRTDEIKRRHANGHRYTDADFSPELGGYSLNGWGSSQVGGPGWAGVFEDDLEDYITNSSRPPGVTWPNGDKILPTTYDPRDQTRVHPGTFRDSQLIEARNLIINVLGQEEAAIALEGVNRLKELDETVDQVDIEHFENTRLVQIPSETIVRSSSTGKGAKHNNVPPSYGVYFWVRVPNDHICDAEVIRPEWVRTITRDKISSGSGFHNSDTNSGQFDLGEWARSQGTDPWNGTDPVVITIAGAEESEEVDRAGNKRPVYIYSDDPGDEKAAAMVIGDFPRGLTIINNGFIMGRGGNGGFNGPGQDGGDAIKITGNPSLVTIDNTNGGIAGGGGGGGGNTSGRTRIKSGGGGGAGGGQGGGSSGVGAGPPGGAPGEAGQNGGAYVGTVSFHSMSIAADLRQIVTDGYGPVYGIFPGIGGQAGGSGGGGTRDSQDPVSRPAYRHKGDRKQGQNSNSAGGGGGRVLSPSAIGGGTGGMPGSEFSGLNADGTIKTTPVAAGPFFLMGHPDNTREVPVAARRRGSFGPKGHPGGKPWRNYGFRYTAGPGNPFTRAPLVNTEYAKGRVVNSYFSPTGWVFSAWGSNITSANTQTAGIHYSTYVHGGYADTPGRNYGANGQWAGGGGGWGAAGGNGDGGSLGGEGGFAIRGGMIEITGGIVYGSQG